MKLKSDIDVFVDLGLPGCFALGFVPGSRPGKLGRQDPHHEVLADAVLKLYRRIELYEADKEPQTQEQPMANPFPMTTDQQTEFFTYLEDIYERWDEFEDCRAYVPGENMWGKVLPEFHGQALVGLNSLALDDDFQWQDIYWGHPIGGRFNLNTGSRAHRRWKNKVWYKYPVLEDPDAELSQREDLMETLTAALGEKHAHPGFLWAGLGYALVDIDEEQKARETVNTALGTKGFVQWDEDKAEGDDTDG